MAASLRAIRFAFALSALCVALAGCEVVKEQYNVAFLRAKLAFQFSLDSVALVLGAERQLVAMVADSARAARDPAVRFAFAESLAVFAVENLRGPHVSRVVVAYTKGFPRFGRLRMEFDPPIVFVPEYHPDGHVRMAPLYLPPTLKARVDSGKD